MVFDNIRNKVKIHLIRWHNKKRVYVCNWAVGITKGKYTDDINKVTCKNCKKRTLILK